MTQVRAGNCPDGGESRGFHGDHKEELSRMVSGRKARRRLALMVALALSTGGVHLSNGGGFLWQGSTAYAAETHDYTETATSINGLEGTDKTTFMSDNNITLGTERRSDRQAVQHLWHDLRRRQEERHGGCQQ